ncbi:MAG: hypothetical protein JO227_04350 [Acetobacteraceae bacterium]|nr:hypothetical protein [Acetobacteraceae bacterium]
MIRSSAGTFNSPITHLSLASCIIITMIGDASTPLITALKYNARMGSTGRKIQNHTEGRSHSQRRMESARSFGIRASPTDQRNASPTA